MMKWKWGMICLWGVGLLLLVGCGPMASEPETPEVPTVAPELQVGTDAAVARDRVLDYIERVPMSVCLQMAWCGRWTRPWRRRLKGLRFFSLRLITVK
jgi:hypothetical protein